MAANPGAGGEESKVSFIPDMEMEPDLKQEDLDKGLAALEEKLNKVFLPKTIDLDKKIDGVREELKPKIDKVRNNLEDLKTKFEDFNTKYSEYKD